MTKRLLAMTLAFMLTLTGFAVAQNVSNYKDQGGAAWHIGGSLVTESGGTTEVKSGGTLQLDAGSTFTIADSISFSTFGATLVQAGQAGTAGTLRVYPTTTAKGYFKLAGVDNTGNYVSTLANSDIGQATVYSLPDCGNATCDLVAAKGTQTVAGTKTFSGNDIFSAAGTGVAVTNNATVGGTLGVTGVATVGGLVTTSPTVVDGVTVNAKQLTLPGRVDFTICGDGTTINNNTVYYGPDQTLVSSATVGMKKCDTTAAGNTTEATADTPALENTAFQVLSMECWTNDPGAAGVTFALRNNAGDTVPSVTCTVANTKKNCQANVQTTTAIAATNPVAIAASSTGDQGTTPFICIVHAAY